MVHIQTLIHGHFRPQHEHNSRDYHLARLHAELLYSYKIKYFAYDCRDVPEDINQPPLWFEFAYRLRENHPLSGDVQTLNAEKKLHTPSTAEAVVALLG
jgi:hypothetical protein